MKHNTRTLSLLTVLALGAQSVAQDPVPTRIKVDRYGVASGTPAPVTLRLGLGVDEGPAALQVSGGYSGELAALLLGYRAVVLSIEPDLTLFVDPVLAVVGTYDQRGRFGMPIEITERSLIGTTLFAQGLQWIQPGPEKPAVFGLQLSAPFAVSFVAGNPQPPLSWSGPPLTATPIVEGEQGRYMEFAVLNQVVVPTSGWELRLAQVGTDGGVTSVYLILEGPGPEEMVMPVLRTERVVARLASRPTETLHVLIEARTRGVPSPPVFQLAAVIGTVF